MATTAENTAVFADEISDAAAIPDPTNAPIEEIVVENSIVAASSSSSPSSSASPSPSSLNEILPLLFFSVPTVTSEYLSSSVSHISPTLASAIETTNPLYTFSIVLLVSYYVIKRIWFTLFPRKIVAVRGYGSGENNAWNRRIRTDRPLFEKKHYKLEKKWEFTGAATTPDMTVCKTQPLGANSAIDPGTGFPLTGHLIGRSTWRVVPDDDEKEDAAATTTSASLSTSIKGKKKKQQQKQQQQQSTGGTNKSAATSIQSSLTFDPAVNPNAGDKIFRAQLLAANGGDPNDANPGAIRGTSSVSPDDALVLGWDFYFKLLCDDGHWGGDYGGPLFLLPGLVITCIITGYDLGDRPSAMITYIRNHQQADGGWGLHLEGPSTLFGTCLNYVAARLLGVTAEDSLCVEARVFMHKHGGATWMSQWGKFWLAILGVYDWEGINPIPPELWILPYWFPFHPGKMWCHSRMPYLPMSYIYGRRCTAAITPIALELRKELYTIPYEQIDWNKARNTVADLDLYAPHTKQMDFMLDMFRNWERYGPSFLTNAIRKRGCAFAIGYVHAEDLHTNYIDIGPVNKAFNMLACWFEGGSNCESFQKHSARVDDYLWVAEDGMKMQGYNGSQLWDTAFATQALAASGLARRYDEKVARIHSFLDASQIKEDVPNRHKYFRTISKGGWPFSTNDHGWPIADCTSEGIKATLAIRAMAVAGEVDITSGSGSSSSSSSSKMNASSSSFSTKTAGTTKELADGFGELRGGHISPVRLYDAVNVLLAFHNPDGGWATYEETRGAVWYEYFNAVESFGDIMIDYTYTELTSSCVQALAQFQRVFPAHRASEVSKAIAAGVEYTRAQQRDDGSWYGSWAVCFTYGCWFGVKALVQGGDPEGRDAEALRKCCAFLLSKQQADGGWGESYVSCLTKTYTHIDSTAVNTAWALLALIHAKCPDASAVRRGVDFLISHQTEAGDWKQEWCSGIFNRTCAITYTAYRNIFPLWALAAYSKEYVHRGSAAGETVTSNISSGGGGGGNGGGKKKTMAKLATSSRVKEVEEVEEEEVEEEEIVVLKKGRGGSKKPSGRRRK